MTNVHISYAYILLFTIIFLLMKIPYVKKKMVMLLFKYWNVHIHGILYGKGTLDRQWRIELIIFTLVSFYLYWNVRKKSARKCNLFLISIYTQQASVYLVNIYEPMRDKRKCYLMTLLFIVSLLFSHDVNRNAVKYALFVMMILHFMNSYQNW